MGAFGWEKDDFSVAAEVLHQDPQIFGGNATQQDLAVMQLGSSAAVPVSVQGSRGRLPGQGSS